MFDSLWLVFAAGLGAVGLCLVVFGLRIIVHEVQTWWWRRSLRAFELHLPRTASVEEVSRWVGTLRAILRARRWWSVLPRWPVGVETTATRGGVSRVVLVPSRLCADVQATLLAVLPGARLEELSYYLTDSGRVRYQVAAEARLKGSGNCWGWTGRRTPADTCSRRCNRLKPARWCGCSGSLPVRWPPGG